jgi:hypothetical protein
VKFFLLSLLVSASLWAQIETKKSVQEKIKVATPEEARPFLLHEAILQAIKQNSTELGIDGNVFEKKLDEKFASWFETYKVRKLSDKFGKNYASELSEDQKKSFLDALETHRRAAFIRFSKLKELLDALKIKEVTPLGPEEWKGTFSFVISRPKVLKLNERLVSSVTKEYSKLMVLTEINLFGMTWLDLGLQKDQEFISPLMSSWNKWLNSNIPLNVEEIQNCTDGCLTRFKLWQEIPQEQGIKVEEDLLNGLFLTVTYNLKKLRHVPNINEWDFEWEGSVVLLDANTKRAIASYTMFPETKSWRGLEQKKLNSALASSMFRSPLDYFSKITKKIQETPRLNRLNRLSITGHRNLSDVLSLIEILKKEGTSFHLELKMGQISQNEVQILCFYQGEEKSFTDLLSRVKELKSSHSYRIVNEFTGVHHVLKLVSE